MSSILLQAIELPSNLMYLFAAFAIAWAGFFIYAALLSRRQKDVQRDITLLNKAVRNSDAEEELV
ncbi:MAG: CcmD family protein [Chloroflexota bacterium]|nr:CcmD family protein [Chloroflexota bacterium]